MINESSGVNPYVDRPILQLSAKAPLPELSAAERQKVLICTEPSQSHAVMPILASLRIAAAALAASSALRK